LASKKVSAGLFQGYKPLDGTYDELFSGDGAAREGVAAVAAQLAAQTGAEYARRQRLADIAFARAGITFTVYSDSRGVEKTFPFDLIPRIITARDWSNVERGLNQRLSALEAFLADAYGPQEIVKAGHIPRDFIERSKGFVPRVKGIKPPGGVYIHVAGIDLVRCPDGQLRVLEDNLRIPSGVSYVLENRNVLKQIQPAWFAQARVRAVDDYPIKLREALTSLAPLAPSDDSGDVEKPLVVVLTPGAYNSAYFEHSFLARRMGVPLVEGRDLVVRDDRVYLKTTQGAQRVHVIYRRVDDDFLDPEAFRPDSMLGVPGLMRAYAAGQVAIANAVGNGVADSKAAYCFVPDMIAFYLGERPIIEQIRTFRCGIPDDLAYVLDHLPELVVKEVDGAGGYGMLVGPRATKEEQETFRAKLKADPAAFVAQPLIELSACPTWTGEGMEPRRVDLRPYVVTGKDGRWALPGGLTRVALAAGSYVVNSSQGGGAKDTWVLQDRQEVKP
jgi:uncharacterized circularly permuted ATP-grasp superfamily protein